MEFQQRSHQEFIRIFPTHPNLIKDVLSIVKNHTKLRSTQPSREQNSRWVWSTAVDCARIVWEVVQENVHFNQATIDVESMTTRSYIWMHRKRESLHQLQQRAAVIPNPTEIRNHHTHVLQAENHIQQRKELGSVEHITWDEPVLLATAIFLIRSTRDNMFYSFITLLDQASEASYICKSPVHFLGLKWSIVDFKLGSERNPAFTMTVQAPVPKEITNPLSSTNLQVIEWDHIKLTDPEFKVPGKIDLLLGTPVFGYSLLPGLIKVSPTHPVAQDTELGWILFAAARPQTSVRHTVNAFHLKVELEDQLKKFFDQEEVPKNKSWHKRKLDVRSSSKTQYKELMMTDSPWPYCSKEIKNVRFIKGTSVHDAWNRNRNSRRKRRYTKNLLEFWMNMKSWLMPRL